IDFAPPDQPLPLDELERLLPLRPGSPLRQDDVHEALQKLFLTGRFADVIIDASPSGDGVALRISTTPNFFVDGVTFECVTDPPNRSQLLTAAKLELGTQFTESEMAQAVANMKERLRANGLYQAKIDYKLDRNPMTEEASVHFQLDVGRRARFDGIILQGTF